MAFERTRASATLYLLRGGLGQTLDDADSSSISNRNIGRHASSDQFDTDRLFSEQGGTKGQPGVGNKAIYKAF